MAESSNDEMETNASSDESVEQLNVSASITESDVDDSDTDETLVTTGTRTELVINNLINKYRERQGKQLYIRFPNKLPSDEEEFQQQTKSISSKIVIAHRPRQKHARFCLVDFNSKDDRDLELKHIKSVIKSDERFKRVFVSIPRIDNEEFIQEIVDKKRKAIEMKSNKMRIKRASKQALRSKNFTSSIVVINLPKSASLSEVKNHFPNAVDVQIKPGKGKMNGTSVASITLPSTMDARAAVRKDISLGGTKLSIRFDTKPKILKSSKKIHQKKPVCDK